MEEFSEIALSNTTLIVALIYPFLFFGYQTKYRYRVALLPRLDIAYSIISALCAAALVIYLKSHWGESSRQSIQLGFLHLIPFILSVALVQWNRKGRPVVLQSDSQSPVKNYENYVPVPLNKEVERLTWDDLIIPQNLKEELISVMELLRDPVTAKRYGIEPPKGILFNGPPGTGKTTIAKVIAAQASLSFFALKIDEVISKWVGESEKNLSKLFDAAVKHSPSVIFIDELDSIGKERDGGAGQNHRETFLNHLLQLVDGVLKSSGVYIIGATNRADLVDSALIRAGRMNKVIEVGLPDIEARRKIFALYLSKLTLEERVDIDSIAEITAGKSPADIREICNQAGLNAFKRESTLGKRSYQVSYDDLDRALEEFLNRKPVEARKAPK